MSSLLARLARALTHNWKRGLAGALAALVLLGVLAGAGGESADDFAIPGTESQQAIDLFKDHSPAFAGVDSTIVFTVAKGKVTDAAPRAAIEGALAKITRLDDVATVADPFASGGQIAPDGKLAAVDVRYDLDFSDAEKENGEALLDAARTAEQGASTSPPAACSSTSPPNRASRSASSSVSHSRSSCSPCCSARAPRWARRSSARFWA